MQKFWAFLSFFIVIIILNYSVSTGSEILIKKNAMMGFRPDSISNTSIETFAIDKINRLKIVETAAGFPQHISLKGIPRIIGRHSFSKLPCVKMYSLYSGGEMTEVDQDPYSEIFFNTCDSSVYHYGGDTFRFSRIARSSFQNWKNQDSVIELLDFYLNTLMIEDSYYILKSESDFSDITKYYNAKGGEWDSIYYSIAKWEQDIKAVSSIFRPPVFEANENQAYMEFITWDKEYGNIESWHFVLTRDFMQIIERREELRSVGPYNYMRRH
jgi:hypothetical protein